MVHDFVFDHTAGGRVVKCLTIVDDATQKAVAIEVERAVSEQGVSRMLDRLVMRRGLPGVIRTDNGKEFCGKAMVAWAHEKRVAPRLIEPSKSLNGRLRDEHWVSTLLHARTSIESWRRNYNGERPKRALGALTPFQ